MPNKIFYIREHRLLNSPSFTASLVFFLDRHRMFGGTLVFNHRLFWTLDLHENRDSFARNGSSFEIAYCDAPLV